MSPKTTVQEHVTRIASHLESLHTRPVETVPLQSALRRVASEPIVAGMSLPPFKNSQMDGFAVNSHDLTEAPCVLPIAGVIAAAPGRPAPLAPGTTVQIMTGAPVPEGADCIIPVEDTAISADKVTISRFRDPGEYIREVGSDVESGTTVIESGVVLTPRNLALLAALNVSEVNVWQRVKIAIISTGSEIVPVGGLLRDGQIPDSNAVSLVALCEQALSDVVAVLHVSDTEADFMGALERARQQGAELVLTSGGISQGSFEVVRQVLEPRGAVVDAIAMQPGGPQAFATFEGIPVVCFPGNPVSTQLSCELFVLPILREIAGLPQPKVLERKLATSLTSPAGKTQYLRGQFVGETTVSPIGGQGSHLVAAMSAADCFIIVPAETTILHAGETVKALEL